MKTQAMPVQRPSDDACDREGARGDDRLSRHSSRGTAGDLVGKRANHSDRHRGRTARFLAGLVICAAIGVLYVLGGLNFVERPISAARFQIVQSEPSDALVLVAIDARSLQALQVWPWPRSWHAKGIDLLLDAGASSIHFDIDFSAASTTGEDAAFERALARAGDRVTLPVFQQQSVDGKQMVTTAPLPAFARHVRVASANVRSDSDGVVRRMGRYETWAGALVPTLATAAAALDTPERGAYLIDFGIRAETLTAVSYVDLLSGQVDPALFAGKTVLIGSTALELGDIATVPSGGVMPGLIIQALATESQILGRDLRPISPWLVMVLTVGCYFLLNSAGRRRGPAFGIVAGLGAAALVATLSVAIQTALPLQLDIAPPLLAIGAAVLMRLIGRLRELDLRLIGQAILLRRNEVLMRQVVASSRDGVLVIDDQGRLQSANPAAEQMLGRKPGEIVGEHFFDVMAAARSQPPIDSLSQMTMAERATQIEITRPDGSTISADVSLSRIPDNPAATFVALLHDVTDMKRREAELRIARDQAEAASNSKSQFLANMSHELRTPLNAVIGFSEVMKNELLGPIGTESYRGYSVSIHDSAKHLLAIINDILDIASIESGTPKLFEALHEPAQLCQSVLSLVQGRADKAHVALKIMVDPQIDLLYADGRMVKQMLINLVNNAIKFSRPHGQVEIKVAPTGDDQGGMIFSVVDHGIGIAKEDIPRIMQPFEQVESAFARNFDGVGLGLPLVSSMARLHGALFTIESALNHGTVASILFPPARTKPRGTATQKDIAAGRTQAAE